MNEDELNALVESRLVGEQRAEVVRDHALAGVRTRGLQPIVRVCATRLFESCGVRLSVRITTELTRSIRSRRRSPA